MAAKKRAATEKEWNKYGIFGGISTAIGCVLLRAGHKKRGFTAPL